MGGHASGDRSVLSLHTLRPVLKKRLKLGKYVVALCRLQPLSVNP